MHKTFGCCLFGLLLSQVMMFALYDPFNYSPGANLIGQTNPDGQSWFQAGPNTALTNQPTIAAGNLTVTGLLSSAGNSVMLGGGGGMAARLNLTNAFTSGTVYFSFAVKVTNIAGLSSSGVFWAGLNNVAGSQLTTPSVVGTRLYTRTAGGGFNFGVAKNSSTTTDWVWDTTELHVNDTIFVVGSYEINTGSTSDDVSRLWINPSSSTFGAASAPATPLIATSGGDITASTVASFLLFNRSPAEPAGMIVDELRIGTSWAEVTPPAPPTGATLSVTPSVISDTYGGTITLQITGLTNGDKVTIQQYLDLNTNGVVDAGEPLIDTFKISDGGVSTIGGVTNLNVPYDSNPTGGVITTSFRLTSTLDTVVGQHLIRLVSPFGSFSPQTGTLIITNAALAQFVSGTIFSGGSPVPNAVAVALSQPNNNFGGGAVADGSGNYVLKLPPGTYAIFPVLPNYFTDQSIAAFVTLTNGGSATANLFLTNGSVANTLSGQIADATNGAPLGGVFFQLESGSLFATTFSESNGTYSAALTPSFWRVRPEADSLARRGYVGPQHRLQVDLTAGSVSNVDFGLPKANAMFYGRFTDNFNVPFANIKFFASDVVDQFKSSGFSDANGYYSLAIFADTNLWNGSPSSEDNRSLLDYIISTGLGVTNVFPGQALQQDFVAVRATATISGRLQDNLGQPVTGVSIYGNAMLGGVPYSTTAGTDNSGHYVLPAANGNWFVSISCCGNDGLDSRGLYDPAQPRAVTIPPTNAVLDLTVYPVGAPVLSGPMRVSPTQFAFTLNGSVGAGYTIQASTNLSISNWFNLFSLNLTSNPVNLQDNTATNRQRFYRALKD